MKSIKGEIEHRVEQEAEKARVEIQADLFQVQVDNERLESEVLNLLHSTQELSAENSDLKR